jgi:Ca2+-dependent lipid-binding protein
MVCSLWPFERRPSETQKTSVKYNDSSPRWRETFDFVMVSAGSTLSINVNNKVGIMDVVTSLKLSKVGRAGALSGLV